jgi:hypothetical protein
MIAIDKKFKKVNFVKLSDLFEFIKLNSNKEDNDIWSELQNAGLGGSHENCFYVTKKLLNDKYMLNDKCDKILRDFLTTHPFIKKFWLIND